AHGEEAANTAAQTAATTFSGGAKGMGVGADLPVVALADAPNIVAAVVALGLASSNKEVRRKLAEGAIRVDGDVVSDPAFTLAPGMKVSFGSKKHGLIQP
ncbi:MAG: tyrosine--tRNA ligase, partial [Alphaproteobacteria bacterium]|nr:tyrosine--tRNA ligase [Alphaproteobacteria bacterium]